MRYCIRSDGFYRDTLAIESWERIMEHVRDLQLGMTKVPQLRLYIVLFTLNIYFILFFYSFFVPLTQMLDNLAHT